MRRGLRRLQKDDHNARVAQLIRNDRAFYRKQKIFETFATFLIIFCFLAFSVYVILSYGFEYFSTPNFRLEFVNGSSAAVAGERVSLVCRGDAAWEWCRWIHMESYCEWEWLSGAKGRKKL